MADMAALNALAGRWATTITMIHPPEEAGAVYRAVDTYRWLPGEQVLVHEVEARMGDEAVNSIEIYSSDGDRIVSRNFDSRGGVSDYRAEMTGGVWRVTGETERFVSSAVTEDVIEGRWELKAGDQWVEWMTVRLDRVG